MTARELRRPPIPPTPCVYRNRARKSYARAKRRAERAYRWPLLSLRVRRDLQLADARAVAEEWGVAGGVR